MLIFSFFTTRWVKNIMVSKSSCAIVEETGMWQRRNSNSFIPSFHVLSCYFICFTQFGSSSHGLNAEKFHDTTMWVMRAHGRNCAVSYERSWQKLCWSSVVELLGYWTCNPEVGQVLSWLLVGFVLTSPEFKSLFAIVKLPAGLPPTSWDSFSTL